MSRLPEYYSAVFVIIKDPESRILFQKRKNTWFRDWEYQLPSWHVEFRETIAQATIRELNEELDINVLEKDIEVLHISHVDTPDRVYFNIYANVLRYSWEIKNKEPDKCSELTYFSLEDIGTDPLFSYEYETLCKINQWFYFSEKKITYK